jgi:hypothetical protein
MLPAPLTVVFVWRSPFAVARSLQQRDGLQLLEGVALWERYNLSALQAVSGSDTYVLEYDGLMADPMGSLEALTDWMASLKQFSDHVGEWDVGRAVGAVADGLRHQASEGDDQVLLPSHHQLLDRLSALHGGHQPLDGQADIVESEWATTLLETRRQLHRELCNLEELKVKRYRELLEYQAELARVNAEYEAELAKLLDWGANMQSSMSWRLTKPVRSVAAYFERGSRSREGAADSQPE